MKTNNDYLMRDIATRIKNRRQELGMSYQDLADKTGLSKSTLQRYETGYIKNMPLDKLEIVASSLSVDPSYIMGWTDDERYIFSIPGILPIQTKKFPLLGNIACGEPMLADQRFEGYIEAGTEIKADFCVKAVGDSMINARILDGDTVFIKKQDDVENGEIAAVLIDCEATLKRVSKNVPGYLQLMPENPNYEPIIINLKELDESVQIKIIGKAVAFQSNVK